MGANGKMQYNPGWESGFMKTLAAHGLAGGIVQDRMGGSFGAGFLSGSLGSYLSSPEHSKNMSEMIGNTARDAVVGGTISMIGGGKFANEAQTGAFRYLFNEGMYHGSKVTEDYWHFLNPGDMVKNKDGHWQMRDNAASYAAGLGGSTATHSCTNSGITYCQVVASFSGSGNTNTTLTVDKINQTTDLIGKFTNKFDKYFAHPVYKVGSYLTNFGSRYNNALQYCQSTCDKQKW
jgi:hypothetical protein